jgi:hypothetical protein
MRPKGGSMMRPKGGSMMRPKGGSMMRPKGGRIFVFIERTASSLSHNLAYFHNYADITNRSYVHMITQLKSTPGILQTNIRQ